MFLFVTVVREEKEVGMQCFELCGVRVLERHNVLQIKLGTSLFRN